MGGLTHQHKHIRFVNYIFDRYCTMAKMDLGKPDEHIHIICLKDSNVELDSTENIEGKECVTALYSNISSEAQIQATDGRTDPLYTNLVTGDNNEYDFIECIDVLTEGSADGNEYEYINEYEHITFKHDICESGDDKNIHNKGKSIEELEIEISTVTNKTKANHRPRIQNIEQVAKSKNI